ncbi:MAG: hypothetical protein ABI873_10295 [Marmoricola sp.]
MGNVTLPTPVFVAGGALCLLGGYLIGAVAGPDTPARTTATVASYQAGDDELCLSGDGVNGRSGVDADGLLCGTWRRAGSSRFPAKGDSFRFVSVVDQAGGGARSSTLIYGDVVR